MPQFMAARTQVGISQPIVGPLFGSPSRTRPHNAQQGPVAMGQEPEPGNRLDSWEIRHACRFSGTAASQSAGELRASPTQKLHEECLCCCLDCRFWLVWTRHFHERVRRLRQKERVPSVSAEDAFLLYRPPITSVIPGHLPF